MSAYYSMKRSTNALGVEHTFCGPGMSRYTGINFQQPNNEWAVKCCTEVDYPESHAFNVAQMLSRAYEAGRQSMAADLRTLIGS